MPTKHAVLSASAADRWINCPGSVMATKDLPYSTSVYAEEGTLAHSLCELKLRKLVGPEPMSRQEFATELDKLKSDPLYQLEMDSCSDMYVEHIQGIIMSYPFRVLVAAEQRVVFDTYVPGGFGTSDCVIVSPDELHIVDYKHGKGVPVSAEENSQLKLYALGALISYRNFYPSIYRVILHIVQPRAGGISSWETTVADLLRWATDVVVPAAKLALSDNAPFCPGEKQCRFCGIRSTCRARMEAAQAVKDNPMFGKLPPVLSDLEVGDAITMGRQVADWLAKLEDYTKGKLENGGKIPGFKLVAGRTSRAWDDQNQAFADLRAEGVDDAFLFERVPLTVAKLEKAIDKKVFARVAAPHVVVSPGKPTMVPESDPREEWSGAKSDFADILKR